MKLNLRQIEVFRAIMLTGSISGAAKLLSVSQPAVSRLISYTEQRTGLKLFERIKGRLHPTPEASRLFVEVNTLYQSIQRVNEVADDLIEQRMGHLRIACSSNLGHSLLPLAIQNFSAQYPDTRIILHTAPPHIVMKELLTQLVELGVAFLPVTHPNLQMEMLYSNRIVAALPVTHHLAKRDCLQVSDLVEETLIGYCNDIPFGELVRQLFDSIRFNPRPRIEVQQVHVACALVEAGQGIALVDEQSVSAHAWPNLITRPIEPVINAPVNVFWRYYDPLSRTAQNFVDILKKMSLAR
ncbi:LysR family transcriptional regulator [Salmonella enterica]|nr:LysR family transcriptional regulator [Salmonella enterica]